MSSLSWYSTRPDDNAERSSCIDFAASIDKDGLDPTIAATLGGAYATALATYTTTRVANEAAAGRADTAGDTVRDRSASWLTAFNAWVAAIDHTVHKGFAIAELPKHLGNRSPSAFTKLSPRSRTDRMTEVFVQVDQDPRLLGDATTQAALRTTTADLRAAVAASEAALKARSVAVKAFAKASSAFDRAWGKLVDDVLFYDPDGLGAKVPKFRRTRDSAAAPEAPVREPVPPAIPPVEPPAEPPGDHADPTDPPASS